MMISVLAWPTCSHNYGTENVHYSHLCLAQCHFYSENPERLHLLGDCSQGQ